MEGSAIGRIRRVSRDILKGIPEGFKDDFKRVSGFSKNPQNRFLAYIFNFGGSHNAKRQISYLVVGLKLPGAEFRQVDFWGRV